MTTQAPLAIRSATLSDASAIARVQVDTWRFNYRGIVPDDYLAKLSYAQRAQRWLDILSQQREFVLVAEREAGVIGFLSGGPARSLALYDGAYDGEITAIYVLPSNQRQGVGRFLFRAAAQEFLRRGLRSLVLFVFAANPARAFYESLGGHLIYEGQFHLDGHPIQDVAYAWGDLSPLTQSP